MNLLVNLFHDFHQLSYLSLHSVCLPVARPISSHFAGQLSGLAEPLLSRFDLALALRSQGTAAQRHNMAQPLPDVLQVEPS